MRKIIHFDLDAFFASVEQRDRPHLRGRPVIVCDFNNGRSVVSTASYEARKFGVHSALPAFKAKKLCPRGYFIIPDFEKYRAVSDSVYEIFHNYTDIVEPAGLDEAYLDVTHNKCGIPSATWLAQDIRYEVFKETGLTISAGVAANKLVAKIASDAQKPNGLTVVRPEDAAGFLANLPIRKIPGVGPVTESICWSCNIKKISDFLKYDDDTLTLWFGKNGPIFRECAFGIDDRSLSVNRSRKSCSVEDTLPFDIKEREVAFPVLESLAKRLEQRLIEDNICGRTVTLKVKYDSFQSITRRTTFRSYVCDWRTLFLAAKDLLVQTEIGQRGVRLLGLGVSQLRKGEADPLFIQPLLFE